jgi:hypothetical protein
LADRFDLAAFHARVAAIAAAAREAPRAGRGIVVAAGGARIFTNAYVLIAILRRTLGCRLPVELWHFGPSELSAAMAASLDGLDVTLVDAEAAIAREGARLHDGWQLKPFALLWSRFAEVLLLDADQVPATDPAAIFDWPEYREAGAVFWPDVIDLRADNPAWGLLGLVGRAAVSFESGQVLVDKRRHVEALAATLALNERAELFYRHLYGDKDTFLMGWRLAGAAHALVPHRPLVDERALFQRDFAGAPLFQHRTQSKWVYAGEQRRIAGFRHEDACLAALAELRGKWNGRVFVPPARDSAARAAERGLVAAGRVRLEMHDEGVVELELRAHHELGAGRAFDRQNWYVTGPEDAMTLVFHDGERVGYSLDRAAPGTWIGRRLRWPVVDAVLRAEPVIPGPPVEAGLVDELLRAADFWTGEASGDADLGRALALIARVETGIVPRLGQLAADWASRDGARAARLSAMAGAIGDRASSVATLRDGGAMAAGYDRLDGARD